MLKQATQKGIKTDSQSVGSDRQQEQDLNITVAWSDGDQGRQILEIVEHDSGQKGSALLDTGAQVDCLDKQFVQQMGKLDQVQQFTRKQYARSLNGKRTEIYGLLKVTLRFPNCVYENVNFYVLDLDGKFNGILGTPFLNSFGITSTMKESIKRTLGQETMEESATNF